MILGHLSIGGFVSHCGWISLLEGIEFGVPIITMPMTLERPLNGRLMVENGVAMEIMRDENGRLEREEIAKVIKDVVIGVLAMEEKYNEAVYSSANRLIVAIDGLLDLGGPKFKDNKRESNFESKEETEEKGGQFTLVVGGFLVIAFVVPMAQYYAHVSKK
ncbi:hypothetical protein ACH5RR_018997 [Cinchona calisaya]|uniref:Uncharacterized protein n=1 Tax=Cinchona calisaya TaxID=153742 RepID=A0ABD2ZT87_9GENT